MQLDLANKTVIIIGATANIGRAIARGFANEGTNVVAVGRDKEAGERLTTLMLERGAAKAIFVTGQVYPVDGGSLL